MQHLVDYPWEGNIRELENFVKYIISTVDSVQIDMDDVPDHLKERAIEKRDDPNGFRPHPVTAASNGKFSFQTAETFFTGFSWEELEKTYVTYLLEKNKWNVSHAAKDARINRSTFDSRMKKLGIKKG